MPVKATLVLHKFCAFALASQIWRSQFICLLMCFIESWSLWKWSLCSIRPQPIHLCKCLLIQYQKDGCDSLWVICHSLLHMVKAMVVNCIVTDHTRFRQEQRCWFMYLFVFLCNFFFYLWHIITFRLVSRLATFTELFIDAAVTCFCVSLLLVTCTRGIQLVYGRTIGTTMPDPWHCGLSGLMSELYDLVR